MAHAAGLRVAARDRPGHAGCARGSPRSDGRDVADQDLARAGSRSPHALDARRVVQSRPRGPRRAPASAYHPARRWRDRRQSRPVATQFLPCVRGRRCRRVRTTSAPPPWGGDDGATVQRYTALDAQHAARTSGTAGCTSDGHSGRAEARGCAQAEAAGGSRAEARGRCQAEAGGGSQAEGQGESQGQAEGKGEEGHEPGQGQAQGQGPPEAPPLVGDRQLEERGGVDACCTDVSPEVEVWPRRATGGADGADGLTTVHTDRKSTRLNSSHTVISYAVFC